MGRWRDANCVDCGKPIHEDYERCYPCNDEYRNATVVITIDKVLFEKDTAYKLRIEAADDQWYPKSEVMLKGDDLYLPRWLAEAKELDYVEY